MSEQLQKLKRVFASDEPNGQPSIGRTFQVMQDGKEHTFAFVHYNEEEEEEVINTCRDPREYELPIILLYEEINGLLRAADRVLHDYYYEYIDTIDPTEQYGKMTLFMMREHFLSVMDELKQLEKMKNDCLKERYLTPELLEQELKFRTELNKQLEEMRERRVKNETTNLENV